MLKPSAFINWIIEVRWHLKSFVGSLAACVQCVHVYVCMSVCLLPSFPGRTARVWHMGLSVCLSVCMSVCMSVWTHNSNLLHSDWLDVFTREVLCPLLGRLRWFGSVSASWLVMLFKDSSRLGDRTKYATKVRHDVNRVVWGKHAFWRHMCVIASEGLSALIVLFYSW